MGLDAPASKRARGGQTHCGTRISHLLRQAAASTARWQMHRTVHAGYQTPVPRAPSHQLHTSGVHTLSEQSGFEQQCMQAEQGIHMPWQAGRLGSFPQPPVALLYWQKPPMRCSPKKKTPVESGGVVSLPRGGGGRYQAVSASYGRSGSRPAPRQPAPAGSPPAAASSCCCCNCLPRSWRAAQASRGRHGGSVRGRFKLH